MRMHTLEHDRKANARPAHVSPLRCLTLIKQLEHASPIRFGDSGTAVGDLQGEDFVVAAGGDKNRPAPRGERSREPTMLMGREKAPLPSSLMARSISRACDTQSEKQDQR